MQWVAYTAPYLPAYFANCSFFLGAVGSSSGVGRREKNSSPMHLEDLHHEQAWHSGVLLT